MGDVEEGEQTRAVCGQGKISKASVGGSISSNDLGMFSGEFVVGRNDVGDWAVPFPGVTVDVCWED